MTTSQPALPPTIAIRRAQPAEAPRLTTLALAAKAYWGYSSSFMAAAAAELAITAASIADPSAEIHVATLPDDTTTIAGVYRLTPLPTGNFDAELSYLWVDPARLRLGLGSLLWEDAMRRAAALGMRRVSVDADPHAEGFYLAMGAERYGEAPSQSIAGRMLPQMAVDVDRALVVVEDRKKKKQQSAV